MAMKKTFAIILNILILFSLSTGQPFCFCVENAECKSTSNLQNEIKAPSSFVAHSIAQVSVNDCCSDCYKSSDADTLIGLQADLNPLEEAIVFWGETYLKKLITHLEISAIERAPPTLTSTNFSEFFIKTERILI
ncbi:MAG: hypothetical protein SFY67_15610 [Candidatus Melainabacteria bacterium]|nr:hypothetical protein [Candidatus Melainabacteria bacterium]